MNATLFGLALTPLYLAIAQVESDRGLTSENVYQLRDIYIDDVNAILIRKHSASYRYTYAAKTNSAAAEEMMRIYWAHWGEHYEQKTGKPVTYEVLARIHNGGPLGWKKPETMSYWIRVRSVLNALIAAEAAK